jgi:hypothetical protein
MRDLNSTPHEIGQTVMRIRRQLGLAGAIAMVSVFAPRAAPAQTLKAEEAYHERFCSGWFIFRDCRTVATRRMTRNFTREHLGNEVAGGFWAGAAHCLTVSYPNERCAQSLAIFTDPIWNRVVWGQPNGFLRAYGLPGDGVEQFRQPAGVAMTRDDGEWHVAFVADAIAGRIVALALGYSCRCVKWLGVIDNAYMGTPLQGPFDVAWDHATTWTLEDDRLFILDSGNDRVVVYSVRLYPALGQMGHAYIGSFGTSGDGPAQLRNPQGITVRSWRCGTQLCADVYIADTGNRRVVHWYYDTPDPSTPAPNPTAWSWSTSDPAADYVGITLDHYGDVFVGDRKQNRLVKLRGRAVGVDLDELKRYGSSSSSWYNGNFKWPTSIKVTRAFNTYNAADIVEEGLPFVNTVEQWSDTTGVQTHRLGVDVDNLTAEAPSGETNIYGRFLFTATGLYSWTIRSPSGVTLSSSGGNVSSRSGWVYPSANASGYGYGTYTLTVQYQSGYMYDDGQWKTKTAYATIPDPNPDPCAEDPTAPGCDPCSVDPTAPGCGGCDDPTEIYCEVEPNAAPMSYELSQDPEAESTSGFEMRRTGLRRVEPRRMLSLSVAGSRSVAPNALDVRLNGITAVRFGVPRASSIPTQANAARARPRTERARVHIRIFDTGGRLVRTALNEDLSPGYYQYQWDMNSDRGHRVAPGVYIVVMTAPGFSKTSKLIVTR